MPSQQVLYHRQKVNDKDSAPLVTLLCIGHVQAKFKTSARVIISEGMFDFLHSPRLGAVRDPFSRFMSTPHDA